MQDPDLDFEQEFDDDEHYAPARGRAPFWHRTRLRWINGLGFAMTLILALWALLIPMSMLGKAKFIPFSNVPFAFLAILGISAVATIGLLIVVFRHMARGDDLGAPQPRRVLFYWSVAGLLYFLVMTVTLSRFGESAVGSALWIPHILYAGVGLVGFGLLLYVNSDLPSHESYDDEDWDDEYEDEYR